MAKTAAKRTGRKAPAKTRGTGKPASAPAAVRPSAPAQADDPHGLSPQERTFVERYVEGWNGAQAAKDAGYGEAGAKQRASELLRRVGVRMAIDAARAEMRAAAGLTRDSLAEVLASLVHTRLDDVAVWDGHGFRLKPLAEIPPHALAALEQVTEAPGQFGTKRSVKLVSKLGAIERAAKLLDLEPKPEAPAAGSGVQIIVQGGPLGLEVHVTAPVPAETPAPARAWTPKPGGVAAAAAALLAQLGAPRSEPAGA